MVERIWTLNPMESTQDFDKQELLECIRQLIEVDKDWVPDGNGTSLYVRPVLIGNEVGAAVGAEDTPISVWGTHRLGLDPGSKGRGG